jgi:hypothetical protein
MPVRARFAQRFRMLTLLRATLIAGALYDLAFAALMVAAPEAVARAFRLPLPGERFYLWLIAVLLAMLAALYLKAAQDPRRYSAVVAVAIAGRLAGAAAFTVAALGRPELSALYPLAAADAAFGLGHALFWWPLRS